MESDKKEDTASVRKRWQRRWRSGRRAVRRTIIFCVAIMASAVVCRLKRRTVLRLANFLGAMAYRCDRSGRRVAKANLILVYGPRLSEFRREQLIRASYRCAARTMLELCWFSRNTAEKMQRWCRISQTAKDVLRQGPGVIVTGHIGNWELGGQVLAQHCDDLVSVAKPFEGALLTKLIARFREGGEQRTVEVKGAVLESMRTLRKGGAVGILLDQWTEPSKGGVVVDFMGTPACISGFAGVLADRTKKPVHIMCCTAVPGGGYLGRHMETIIPTGEQTPQELAQLIADALGRMIRRYPAQWLWMYRRWKRIIPGTPPSEFPFYAREMGQRDAS